MRYLELLASRFSKNSGSTERMAEPPSAEDGVEEGQVQKKKYLNEQAQGLEKVTDYVEEQEISGLQNVRRRPSIFFGESHVILHFFTRQ